MGVEFGLFDHLDIKSEPPARTLRDRLAFIRAAEAAGFRNYHIAEHHGTPLGMGNSPSVFLGAVAQATSRIRFGPLIYLLPLYEPLRLIEEICLLDHLSEGRFEPGVGRAVSPIEMGFFGVDAGTALERTDEALAVLRAGLANERLTHHGRFFHYEDVPLPLRPLQARLPMWSASMSPPGIEAAARAGMHSAALGNPKMVKDAVDTYRAAYARHASDPLRAQWGAERPLNGMSRMVVVAATDAEAERIARPAYLAWFGKLIKLWREHGVEAPLLGALDKYETARAIGMLVCGSPGRVLDELATQIAFTDVNYVLCQMTFGSLTNDEERESLRLFAEQVMPQLK